MKVKHSVVVSAFSHDDTHFREKGVRLNILQLCKRELDLVGAVFEVVMAVFELVDNSEDPF